MAKRRLQIVAILLVALAAALFVIAGYRNATADPLVRRLNLAVPDYPASAPPIRLVLFSDIHVHGPDMPPERVERIVDQINALRPDVVIAAGDFVGDSWIGREYPASEAIAPLRALRARFGVYAVLGNNDYDADSRAVVGALEAAGVRVLMNNAVRAGPLAIGGVDGAIFLSKKKWWARRAKTYAALERTPGSKILVAHRPDEFTAAPPWIPLVLAGHTHCGQIVLPLIGPVETGSDYGTKYLCGIIRDGPKTLVVTGGVGTSHLPLRIGAPPDIWLISIGGQAVSKTNQP